MAHQAISPSNCRRDAHRKQDDLILPHLASLRDGPRAGYAQRFFHLLSSTDISPIRHCLGPTLAPIPQRRATEVTLVQADSFAFTLVVDLGEPHRRQASLRKSIHDQRLSITHSLQIPMGSDRRDGNSADHSNTYYYHSRRC